MTPGWFTSTCLAVSSADAAIRRVGELGPYRLEADSRQKIKNKNKRKEKFYLYLELFASFCMKNVTSWLAQAHREVGVRGGT